MTHFTTWIIYAMISELVAVLFITLVGLGSFSYNVLINNLQQVILIGAFVASMTYFCMEHPLKKYDKWAESFEEVHNEY